MLQVTAQSQARLIEAVARYDATVADKLRNADVGYDASAATLGQIIDAHGHYEGFGGTGEFTLARRDGAAGPLWPSPSGRGYTFATRAAYPVGTAPGRFPHPQPSPGAGESR